MLTKIKEKIKWAVDKVKKFWQWIVGGVFITATAATLLTPSYPVEYVTAPENNTFKIGVQNYQTEFKESITDDRSLQYKLDDKFISFKPVEIRIDGNPIKMVQGSQKAIGKARYNGVFGEGIDLAVNTGQRVWNKVVKIDSLDQFGYFLEGAENLEIVFEIETNFVIDGWNKHDDFEITDKVRLGDFSYIESASAWDSYSEEVCKDIPIYNDTDTIIEEYITECEILTNRIQVKSILSEDKGRFYLTKQIPIEWLKSAQSPIYTDADVTYGTALEFDDGAVDEVTVTDIDTNKFAICWEDTNLLECRVGSVSNGTITYGAAVTVDADTSCNNNQTDICKLDTDKFAVTYCDDGLADDGYVRATTVTGEGIDGFGTAKEFDTGDSETITCSEMGTDKFAIIYNDETAGDDLAGKVCTAAGTTISCPTAETEGMQDWVTGMGCDGDNSSKFVCILYNTTDGAISGIAGSVSGTTITWGAENQIESSSQFYGAYPKHIKFLDTDNFVAVFKNWVVQSPSNLDGDMIAGTLSGETITWGTVNTFNADGCAAHAGQAVAKIDTTNFVNFCADGINNSAPGRSYKSSVNFGTRAISAGSEETFNAANVRWLSSSQIDSDSIVLCYQDDDNSDVGECIIGDTEAAPPEGRRRGGLIEPN